MAHTDAGVKVENFVVENGELTITVAMPSTSQWLLCQGFEIYYKAESLDEYANLFYAAKAAAEAFNTEDLNTAAADQISAALSAAATEQVNKEWYQTRTEELNAAIALANEVKAPYANFKSLITQCESTLSNSEEFEGGAEDTFTTAINTAKNNVAPATTAGEINAAYNTLEEARRVYIKKADPVNGGLFDYTFMIVNPGFDNGTNGWDCESPAQNKQINSNKDNGVITGSFFENWNPSNFTGTISQSISGLPSGKYLLKVAAFGTGANVFANNEQVGVTSGDGVCYEVEVAVSEGTLTFGIKNENATNWIGIDNASLYYKGFDVETAKAGITSLISQAEDLAAKPMNKDVLAGLNETMGDAREILNVDYPTRKELNTMMEELNQAMDNANASIAEYNTIATYIAKAKAIGVALADDYQTQYDNRTLSGDAVTIFQNLEVATYNYVMSNFTYPVKLSDTWNSTGTNTQAATFSNEHWSGETREYKNQEDGNNWGWGAQSWSIDFDQEVTLPAGEYVFKVAGRKSEGTTLELVVTMGATVLGTVNDFPASNNSRGINKLGATSFDPEDKAGFARNGEGFGWQWRYVRFVLNSESTVKVAVHAEANEVHQWVSFGDYTLQMTEDTYLEANKGGLDAPTAAANALVNTKPMGTEENNALKAALAMTYTTGAELLAKIEALETAIANANAWVPKYNEAKAPLVAALERFEADYNDAQNGALNHMNKDRWTTAINMAQAAAVAKDATDSYDGFETATNNLVAALEAATTSVNEYSALDAAIKTASSLYLGGNWGDQPFQRPTSAKENLNTTSAQNVYDAANADGEGVTSVTVALNNGLNGIVINEPAVGDVFKVAISFDNWDFNGKPLTFADNGKDGVSMYRDRDANYYAQTLMLKKVEGNKYTMSTIAADGTELYASTGITSGVGANTAQIRLTDDATKALSIEIIPTATEGLYNLKNTEADALLGCQDDNSKEKGGFFTTPNCNNFTITKVDMPSVTLKTPSYWATLILPFAAEIPEGLTVYSCAEADGEVLTLETVESIEANTPYLVCGTTTDFEHTFTGFGAATTTSYTVGLFTGTYVDYKTTANSNTYVLQKISGDVAFYLVGEGENAQPTVGANRCYMTYDDSEGGAAQAQVFRLVRGGTTSIDNMESTGNGQQAVVIYDLMGRKVSTMEKGNMYIVNGVKVIIK